jgi:hypothetical protein
MKLLVTAINRQNVLFVWECNLPRPDDRESPWTQTMLDAVNAATRGWVRVAANMSLGAYDVSPSAAPLSEPEWPQVSFRDILKVAFKGRYVASLDHPKLRQLRGEI